MTIFRLVDFDSSTKKAEIDAINAYLDDRQMSCENSGQACNEQKLLGI